MSIEKLETNLEQFKVNKKEDTKRSRFALSKQQNLSGNG